MRIRDAYIIKKCGMDEEVCGRYGRRKRTEKELMRALRSRRGCAMVKRIQFFAEVLEAEVGEEKMRVMLEIAKNTFLFGKEKRLVDFVMLERKVAHMSEKRVDAMLLVEMV